MPQSFSCPYVNLQADAALSELQTLFDEDNLYHYLNQFRIMGDALNDFYSEIRRVRKELFKDICLISGLNSCTSRAPF